MPPIAYIQDDAPNHKMNPEVKPLWTADLLSGEYRQGTGELRTPGPPSLGDGFCCLGVLSDRGAKLGICQAFHPEDDPRAWAYGNPVDHTAGVTNAINTAYVPASIMVWADLGSNNPSVKLASDDPLYENYGPDTTLAGLNDAGVPFAEIARVIDRYL